MDHFEEVERLQALLENGRYAELSRQLREMHEADVADFINEIEPKYEAVVFRLLGKDQAAEVFAQLDKDVRTDLLSAFKDHEVREIIEELYVDDAVDFLEELPANAVARVLKLAGQETRQQLNRFLHYQENSAGSVMTAEYMRLKKDMTVGEAIHLIRTHGADTETINTCYVTDERRLLEGVISIRDLLLGKDEQRIAALMDTDIISVETHEDQEEVVRIFHNYDLLSLPVVDGEKRLVGIITVDDVMDVAEEEVTEDFSKMALVEPSDEPYLKTGVWFHARSRVTWLLILMISGMVNGSILQRYEHAFVALPILVTFIPMLTDTGGNAGSQSSTIVIRGMALDEIRFRDIWQVLWTELRVSLLVGTIMCVVNFVRIYFFYDRDAMVGLTVSLALMGIVILSKLIGSALPLLAKKVGLDPAIMAAPLITTVVDAFGLILYFSIAHLLLPI